MNTKTLLTVKIDKNLKQAAQETADKLGFSLGTLVNAYIKQLVRTKEITFSESYVPSDYLKWAIEESRKEDVLGRGKRYKSVREMVSDLEK